MKILLNIFVSIHIITFVLSINVTKKTQDFENTYYFVNYDYNDDENNDTIDVKSLVFPTSEDGIVDYEGDHSAFQLPDDSLADSDLKDHDLIDSITYVYNVKPHGINNEYSTILIAIEFTLNGIILVYGLARTISQLRKYSQVGTLIHLQLLAAMLLFNILLLVNLSKKSENICKLIALGINYSQSIIIFWIFTYICCVITDTGIQHGLFPILYCHACLGGSVFVLFLKLEPIRFGEFCFLPGAFTTAMVPAILFAIVLWILRYKYNTIFIPRIWNLHGCKKSSVNLDTTTYRKLTTPYESSKESNLYEKLLQLEANDDKIIVEEFPNTPIFGKHYNLVHTFILITYIATFSILYIRRYEMVRCIASIIATVFICCFCKVISNAIHMVQDADSTVLYADEVENSYTPDVPEIINEVSVIN